MRTLEETIKLIAEEHAKLVEENQKFSTELREFKEENRIGFAKLRKSQQRNERLFNDQWGKLVEALVNNRVVSLLQSRGISVKNTSQRIKGSENRHNFEFDIIAENGDSIVVIEVKTTLRVDDVKRFLKKLSRFKTWLPRYSDLKVYGAVAFLHEASEAAIFAEKFGLFTILATSSSAEITNPSDFNPKEF